ncbi:MAG: hypothetical protein R3190_01575 [Thermoanaerobaculia bacterium]|nr:hypothetical protein [Thermoanaerobaculia bacterium]
MAFRYRYEGVDEEAFDKEGQASTLRTVVSYRTLPWRGLSLFLEAEDVHDLGAADLHDNGGFGGDGNGVADRPVIKDVEGTELNQAHLRISLGETTIDAGRREIELGDQRFVSSFPHRQNRQSFDALAVRNETLAGTTLTYVYSWNANRVDREQRHMETHLLDARIDLGFADLAAYGYLVDFTQERNFGASTDTFGLELSGANEIAAATDVVWEAEIADQSDAGDNPGTVDALYARLRAGVARPTWKVEVSWELLEGSPGRGAFSTPLATVHKWHGWADKFGTTPENGLDDLNVKLTGTVGRFEWLAVAHRFASDTGGLDYGSELDLRALWRSPWEQTFAVDAALYDADAFATDTTKVWFWTSYAL